MKTQSTLSRVIRLASQLSPAEKLKLIEQLKVVTPGAPSRSVEELDDEYRRGYERIPEDIAKIEAHLPYLPVPQERPRAILDEKTVEFDTVEQKFEALAQIWRKNVRGKSIISYSHYAYFQIMTMGRPVVPFLLQEVANGAGTWYVALQYIVNETPESPEMRGDPAAVRQAWLDWGIRNGYSRELEKASRND